MIDTVTLNPALDYFMDYGEIRLGAVNRARAVRLAPGGKGIMESRMLSRLGVAATALGFIGGFSGEHVRELLEREGVRTAFTATGGETRVNVKLKSQQEETSLDAAGPELTEEDVRRLLSRLDGLAAGDIVSLAGTIPRSLGEDFYARLIRAVTSRGADFAMDADGEKLLRSLSARPLVVKPNREELSGIFGVAIATKEDVMPYGRKMLAMGAQQVMVSMAGDGALLFAGEKVYFAPAVAGIVKNSVGAGDATVAGFLASWSLSRDPVAAFKQGVACGTAKAFSEDMPSRRFINACYDKIEIKEIPNGD